MNAYYEEGSSDIDEITAKVIRVVKNDIEIGRGQRERTGEQVKHYNIYRARRRYRRKGRAFPDKMLRHDGCHRVDDAELYEDIRR